MEDLLGLSGEIACRPDEDTDLPVAFDIAEAPHFCDDYAEVPFKELQRHFVILRATIHGEHVVYDFPEDDKESGDLSLTFEDRAHISKASGAAELRKTLFELVMASNIAKPGALMPEGGAMFIDGCQHQPIPRWLNPLDSAFEATKELDWPAQANLAMSEVWEWLADVPNFKAGFGSTDLGRGLAAFSYLFGDYIDGAHPFSHGLWAILGLEAIYGSGTELVARQLVERTNAFLGEEPRNKKALRGMYSFRSRFLHGDMNLPYGHCREDGSRQIEQFYNSSMAPEALAVRVLTATLQQMARQGRYQLAFRVEVE